MIAYKSVVINYQRVLRCEGNKPQFQLEYNNKAFNVRAIDSALARDAVARGTADHVTDRSHDHSHACHITTRTFISPKMKPPMQSCAFKFLALASSRHHFKIFESHPGSWGVLFLQYPKNNYSNKYYIMNYFCGTMMKVDQ